MLIEHNDVYDNEPFNYCKFAPTYEQTIWTGINGNISDNPNFVDSGYWDDGGTPTDPNDDYFVSGNYHLLPDSPCIDAGDPNLVTAALIIDMDYEPRIFGQSVDIGADEYYWPKADFDRNEIVNFIDYAIWAPAWQTTDPNKSLDPNDDVDIYDLAQFCDDWLWIAP